MEGGSERKKTNKQKPGGTKAHCNFFLACRNWIGIGLFVWSVRSGGRLEEHLNCAGSLPVPLTGAAAALSPSQFVGLRPSELQQKLDLSTLALSIYWLKECAWGISSVASTIITQMTPLLVLLLDYLSFRSQGFEERVAGGRQGGRKALSLAACSTLLKLFPSWSKLCCFLHPVFYGHCYVFPVKHTDFSWIHCIFENLLMQHPFILIIKMI